MDMYDFESIYEAQLMTTQWLWKYSHERSNMGIGGIPLNRS